MAYTTINKGSSYFNTLLYTGNGSTLTVTGNNFQPDFTWIKERSAAGNHKLADVVRGTTKYLSSNLSDAEDTTGSGIQSWNSTGFSLSNATDINDNSQTYAAWNWLGSNTTTNNTSGTISSTVCANTTSGFSIVNYTGAGGASTVGHGLGVAPKVVIIKSRSNSTTWVLGHNSLGWNKYIALNLAEAVETNNYFNDTAPTSSVFSVYNSTNVNGSGYTYVAYCFAEIKGYSKFGSYTGNGNADGTFVYTGFKPAFVMIKQTSASGEGWEMADDVRSTYNVVSTFLRANSNATESTNTDRQFDFVSNGIKMRGSHGSTNGSGATYIYMAFAENPLVGTNNIPTTAR